MKKNNSRKMMSLGLVGAMTLSMTAVSFADTATPELINSEKDSLDTILANTASAEIMTGKLVGISQPNNMDPMYKVVNDQHEVLFTVTEDTVLGENVSLGDEVAVAFDGVMTMSIPALATADSIVKVPGTDDEVPVVTPDVDPDQPIEEEQPATDVEEVPVQLPELDPELPVVDPEVEVPVQLPEVETEDGVEAELPMVDLEDAIPVQLPETEIPEVEIPEVEVPEIGLPEAELPTEIPVVEIEDSIAVESPSDLEDEYAATFAGTILNVDLVDGEGRILVQTEEGMEVIFNINADTESDIELSELKEGDNVVIGFNGIMTMSLPGISNAQFITVVDADAAVDAQ